MRKGILKISFIAVILAAGAVWSGCGGRMPINTALNSSANQNVREPASASGNLAESGANVPVNGDVANTPKNADAPKSSATPDKKQAQTIIERYIAGVAKVSDASEYKEARKILYGDLDGDGDEDAIAQFTIEGMGGGNNYGFYLAAFRNEDGKFTAITDEVVGGKLNRDVELKRIDGGKIYLDTKEYDEDDGACCPSIEGKTTFILEKDKLKEVKTDGKK